MGGRVEISFSGNSKIRRLSEIDVGRDTSHHIGRITIC